MSIDEGLGEQGGPAGPVGEVDDAFESVVARQRRNRRPLQVGAGVGAVVLVLAGFVAASSRRDDDSMIANRSRVESLHEIVGVAWRFDRIEFDDGRPAIDVSDTQTDFELGDVWPYDREHLHDPDFKPGGSYSALICNNTGGLWSTRDVSDDQFRVDAGTTTMAKCSGKTEGAEVAFFQVLNAPAITWWSDGVALLLTGNGVTAHLRRPDTWYPDDVHPLFAGSDYLIGYRTGDGMAMLIVLDRRGPGAGLGRRESVGFDPASGEPELEYPVGLVLDDGRVLFATWVPQGTSKAGVVLAPGGGVDVSLDLERVANGVVGWAELPAGDGEVIAFDAEGNEIDRASFSIESS